MLGNTFEDISTAVALIRAAGAAFTQVTRGLSTAVTRTSAGLYVVTSAQAIPSANCQSIATILGAATGTITVTHTSDTVKTIATFNSAGAAADLDFDVRFQRVI